MVAPGEEPADYEPVPGLTLPPAQTPVLTSEAGLFDLNVDDLRDVRVWREIPIIEVRESVGANGTRKKVRRRIGGSGLWYQTEAFWTAPAPARKLTAKQLAEREGASETTDGHVGEPTGAESRADSAGRRRIRGMTCHPMRLSCARRRRGRASSRSSPGRWRTRARCLMRSRRPGTRTCGACSWRCRSDAWARPPRRLVASAFGSLDAIANATAEDLSQIDGIGPEIAESVVHWFAAAREDGDWRGAILKAWRAAGVGTTVETNDLPQDPDRQDRGGHRRARGLLARLRQGGDHRPRRQGGRIGQQEDRLRRRRRERRLQGRQGRGTGTADARRGRLSSDCWKPARRDRRR